MGGSPGSTHACARGTEGEVPQQRQHRKASPSEWLGLAPCTAAARGLALMLLEAGLIGTILCWRTQGPLVCVCTALVSVLRPTYESLQ